MKKQLPTNGIANELVGSSVFFGARSQADAPTKQDTAKQSAQVDGKRPRAISGTIKPSSRQSDSTQPRQRGSTVASNHATTHGPTGGPMPSGEQATTETEQHPAIRDDKHDAMPPFQSDSTKANQPAAMQEAKSDPMPSPPRESAAESEPASVPTPDAPVSIDQAMMEEVRKAVKPVGKEAATYRLTVAEKQALSDIAYAYQRRRIKTSENEIARIAINWLLLDYRSHKTDSVLARLLDLLHG